jgi:hypothetical protein
VKKLIITLIGIGLTIISYFHFSKESNFATDLSQNKNNQSLNHREIFQESKKNLANSQPTKQVINDIAEHNLDDNNTENHTKQAIDKHKTKYKIPLDIKEKICEKDSDDISCTINLESQYETNIFTDEENLLSAEISVILTSRNFSEVLTDLSSKKITKEAFEQEVIYNEEFASVAMELDISSDGISCGDKTCGLIIRGNNEKSLKDFKESFMKGGNKGNIFITFHADDINHIFESRVMFFPDNNNAVVSRVK